MEQAAEEEVAQVEENQAEDTKEQSEGAQKEGEEQDVDAEIEAMKKRFKEMEEEAAKIDALQKNVEQNFSAAEPYTPNREQDARSIYVGSVDYSTTPEELKDFFSTCGNVVRVTILSDKWTGPKGYAYVEFKEKDSVVNAMILNETPFKGRNLKVSHKRTNVAAFSQRGRGAGAAGRGRGAYAPRPFRPYRGPPRGGGDYYGGYAPRRPFRARRGGYHPYY